ncbi:MAG: PIN domain-containing protein [Chitinophagaceae bacterium]
MAVKVFLDINTIIDFFDGSRSGHLSSRQLIELSESHDIAAYLSESVLNTTINALRKEYKTERMRSMLSHLLEFITILPCTNSSYLKSLQLPTTDLEDAVLYQIAIDNKLDYFVTSNKKDFKKIISPLLPVVSSKELIDLIS